MNKIVLMCLFKTDISVYTINITKDLMNEKIPENHEMV